LETRNPFQLVSLSLFHVIVEHIDAFH